MSSLITSVSGAVASAVVDCLDGETSSCSFLSGSVSFTTPTATPSSPYNVYNVTTASAANSTETATISLETHSASPNASETFAQYGGPIASNSAGIGAYAFEGAVMFPLAVMTILGWFLFAA